MITLSYLAAVIATHMHIDDIISVIIIIIVIINILNNLFDDTFIISNSLLSSSAF